MSQSRIVIRPRIFLLFFCIMIPAVWLSGQTLPLLIVADLEHRGIPDSDMRLLVDLYSYTLFETDGFLVLNRYERNKLLKGFGYDQSRLQDREAYLEAGELLRAGYLVLGSCLQEKGTYTVSLSLWDVNQGALQKTVTDTYPSMEKVIVGARDLTVKLAGAGGTAVTRARPDSAAGLSETLYVSRIRERLLVVFPAGVRDEAIAVFHVLINEACGYLYQGERMNILFSNFSYDPDAPDIKACLPLLKERDCHTLALLSRGRAGVFSLVLYADDGSERMRIPCFPARERKKEAERIAKVLTGELPPLTPAVIARELGREETIKEKLDMLLFNERFLSRPFFINVHVSVIKPAIVNKYHPLLNLIGLEGDFYWYYASLIGCGIGYAFSLGYPATIDSHLTSHPLVAQHEFRLIPLSFRSAGAVSVFVNLIASLNMQNAYRIVYYSPIDKYEFYDEIMLFMLKFSLNMGILINLSDDWSVFIDLATLSYIIPLNIGTVTYDGTRISGAFGGAGVILRF